MDHNRRMTSNEVFFQYRDELQASSLTNAELLEMARENIRSARLAMPGYRRAQEDRRYHMTVEDLEDVEALYQSLVGDTVGVHEPEDYVDAVVRSRAIVETQITILDRAAKGLPKPSSLEEESRASGQTFQFPGAGLDTTGWFIIVMAILTFFALGQVPRIGWLLGLAGGGGLLWWYFRARK